MYAMADIVELLAMQPVPAPVARRNVASTTFWSFTRRLGFG